MSKALGDLSLRVLSRLQLVVQNVTLKLVIIKRGKQLLKMY
jgi:hypothetical protein